MILHSVVSSLSCQRPVNKFTANALTDRSERETGLASFLLYKRCFEKSMLPDEYISVPDVTSLQNLLPPDKTAVTGSKNIVFLKACIC